MNDPLDKPLLPRALLRQLSYRFVLPKGHGDRVEPMTVRGWERLKALRAAGGCDGCLDGTAHLSHCENKP